MNVSYWSLTCTIYYYTCYVLVVVVILGSRIRVYYLWPVGWSTWEHCCQSCGLVICPAWSTRVVDVYQNQGCTHMYGEAGSFRFKLYIILSLKLLPCSLFVQLAKFCSFSFSAAMALVKLNNCYNVHLIYHFITSSVRFHFILDFSTWPYFVFQFFSCFFLFIVCSVAKACIHLSLKIHRY